MYYSTLDPFEFFAGLILLIEPRRRRQGVKEAASVRIWKRGLVAAMVGISSTREMDRFVGKLQGRRSGRRWVLRRGFSRKKKVELM